MQCRLEAKQRPHQCSPPAKPRYVPELPPLSLGVRFQETEVTPDRTASLAHLSIVGWSLVTHPPSLEQNRHSRRRGQRTRHLFQCVTCTFSPSRQDGRNDRAAFAMGIVTPDSSTIAQTRPTLLMSATRETPLPRCHMHVHTDMCLLLKHPNCRTPRDSQKRENEQITKCDRSRQRLGLNYNLAEENIIQISISRKTILPGHNHIASKCTFALSEVQLERT